MQKDRPSREERKKKEEKDRKKKEEKEKKAKDKKEKKEKKKEKKKTKPQPKKKKDPAETGRNLDKEFWKWVDTKCKGTSRDDQEENEGDSKAQTDQCMGSFLDEEMACKLGELPDCMPMCNPGYDSCILNSAPGYHSMVGDFA